VPEWHDGRVLGSSRFGLLSLAVMPPESPWMMRMGSPAAKNTKEILTSSIIRRITDLPLRLHVRTEMPLPNSGELKGSANLWHIWLQDNEAPVAVHTADALSSFSSPYLLSSIGRVNRRLSRAATPRLSEDEAAQLSLAFGNTAASVAVDQTEQLFDRFLAETEPMS
jgi:hypothetical protein